MFHQANNVVINGGQFTVAENSHDAVSTILWQHVAAGAIFDSAERYAAGKCHSQTRQKVIDQMTSWIKDPNPPQRILWMYGPAGSGKSALMQSLCELLRDLYPGQNGGSFFFAKGDAVRGNATRLFVTLSYQLAVQFPHMRTAINEALSRDPSLPTKSMDIQLRSLIIDPLLRCPDFPTTTPTLFIDGLDECNSDRTQRQIITLISKSIIEHDIPIRFIIASRPEFWIRDTFETSPLPDMTYPLSLRDDIDVDDDIEAYLRDGFEKIRQDNKRIMQSVDSPWPPDRIIEQFVYEASGQYIYASTILKFVGNDSLYNDPQEQLKILLNSGPDRAPAFTELDRLYQTIASVYPRWEPMKRVLGGLLIGANLTAIRVLLGVPQTEITLVLDALSSLIDISQPEPLSGTDQLLIPIFGSSLDDEQISFCHLSFREFLLDKFRSGSYHVEVDAIRHEAVSAFFDTIQRNLDRNYEIEPHISCGISISEYCRMMKSIIKVGASQYSAIRCLLPELNGGIMESFRRFDPGRRMIYPACFMRDMELLSKFLSQMEHSYRASRIEATFQHNPDSQLQDSDLVESFSSISNQLYDITSMARKIGLYQLSLCDGFNVTHTLFYIDYMSRIRNWRVTIQDLSGTPGITVADIVSTIQQHCHIIELPDTFMESSEYSITPGQSRLDPASMSLVDLGERLDDVEIYWPDWSNEGAFIALDATIDGGWLCRREWENRRISLACEFLKSVMINLDHDWERSSLEGSDGVFRWREMKYGLLTNFLNTGHLSDIRGEEYFENQRHLSFVEVMSDSEIWMNSIRSEAKLWIHLDRVINPVLVWFDRQLTHPTAIRLMEEHDIFLPQKLKTAMSYVFQHYFMPIFKTPYFCDLLISTFHTQKKRKTIRIKVLQSNLLQEETVIIPSEDYFFFNVPTFLTREDPPPPISISQWHPLLATYILNMRVKELYRQTHPEFRPSWAEIYNLPFLPIVLASDVVDSTNIESTSTPQWIQYAETTPQNLDALRAIKHLYWQVDHTISWLGTWPQFISPVREFLKRYEPSDLCSDELYDFEYWLEDIKESYEPLIPPEEKELSASFQDPRYLNFGRSKQYTYLDI